MTALSFSPRTRVVAFPKFKLEKNYDLIANLKELGLTDLSDANADFSRLSTEKLVLNWVSMSPLPLDLLASLSPQMSRTFLRMITLQYEINLLSLKKRHQLKIGCGKRIRRICPTVLHARRLPSNTRRVSYLVKLCNTWGRFYGHRFSLVLE